MLHRCEHRSVRAPRSPRPHAKAGTHEVIRPWSIATAHTVIRRSGKSALFSSTVATMALPNVRAPAARGASVPPSRHRSTRGPPGRKYAAAGSAAPSHRALRRTQDREPGPPKARSASIAGTRSRDSRANTTGTGRHAERVAGAEARVQPRWPALDSYRRRFGQLRTYGA